MVGCSWELSINVGMDRLSQITDQTVGPLSATIAPQLFQMREIRRSGAQWPGHFACNAKAWAARGPHLIPRPLPSNQYLLTRITGGKLTDGLNLAIPRMPLRRWRTPDTPGRVRLASRARLLLVMLR